MLRAWLANLFRRCLFEVPVMIIATRHLLLREKGRTNDIPVGIHAPEKAKVDWICRFEIGWPEGKVERWGTGVDAVQALLFAMQMIGAEVYARSEHKSGRLEWLEAGGGYGFPVPGNIRALLVGDDRRFL
jgi:hypothetical protein